MTGRDIVCVAPTEWDGAWQRYHAIMQRLAASGNEVLVLDNFYRVAPLVPRSRAAARRLMTKVWTLLRTARGRPRQVAPGIRLLAPLLPPSGRFMRLAARSARRSLRAALRDHTRPAVLWCAFPTPLVHLLEEVVRPELVVYDCASAFAEDPAIDASVVDAERVLLQRADVVFTDSRGLWQRHAAAHPRCVWVPTGVDVARFAAAAAVPPAEPPVVGYVGTLHAWLDVDLIAAVALARPLWQFVFVGPRRARADLRRLEQLPNVVLAGPAPHAQLPVLLARYAAAWIPYRLTSFTRYVFPTKLLEYLAAGRPVVSTDLPEVRAFAPPVRIGTTAEAITAHLDAAVAAGREARGPEVAQGYDWTKQMAVIHAHLDAALAREGL